MPKAVFNIAYTSKYPPKNMPADRKAEYLDKRAFYNGTAEFNIFKYLLDGKKVVKNKDIFSYMGNDEKSTGVFDMNGELDAERLEEIQKEIGNTDSTIWHGVISFDEEMSKGFQTQESAVKFMKQSFNAFLDRTHLNKKNLVLIAALHEDTDNRHIHFTFYEKKPMHRNKDGSLSYTKKGNFSNKAIENYLVSANMHLSEHSYDYYSARDRAMNALKELRSNSTNNMLTRVELMSRLRELDAKLPKIGRLQYNAQNMKPFQKDIDYVAQLLIKADPVAAEADRQFREALAKKEQEAYGICNAPVHKQLKYVNDKEMRGQELQQLLKEGKTEFIRSNNIDWENIDYFEQLRQDYNSRIGNQVLGLIKSMKKSFGEKSKIAYNDKQKKIQSRIARQHRKKVFNNFMKALASHQLGIKADFTHRLHEVQYQIEQEQISQE